MSHDAYEVYIYLFIIIMMINFLTKIKILKSFKKHYEF